MADFNIRSESVDVEQIMKQIRTRIREKRGVDYTEDQIRELATVRLETFLDPKNLRSDLLEQFRRSRPAIAADPPPVEPPYVFDDQTLFASHRGVMRWLRRLLRPVLKLMFNPNTLNQLLHAQAQFNVDLLKREQRRKIEFDRSRADWNALYYEVLHNLVLETTRNGIELKNMKMRLEALASRLDFSERRVRALEGVVQYRPEAVRSRDRDRDRDKDQSREQSRDQNRDQNRDRDNGRDRGRDRQQPRLDAAPAAPDQVETELTAPAATDALSTTGVTDAIAAPGMPGSADPASRRRRRRRRGRRGAGSLSGGVPGTSEQGVAGENANGTDEGLDEGDDSPEGDVETAGQGDSKEPGSGTPNDPDQQ